MRWFRNIVFIVYLNFEQKLNCLIGWHCGNAVMIQHIANKLYLKNAGADIHDANVMFFNWGCGSYAEILSFLRQPLIAFIFKQATISQR